MAESTCLKEVVVEVNIWGWNCVDSKAHELKGSNSDWKDGQDWDKWSAHAQCEQ